MRITTPIYYVTIEGNLKEIVSELPDVIIATYEDYDNKTLVVVKASNKDESSKVLKYFYRLHSDLLKHKKQFKKEQVIVTYSPNGINFNVKKLFLDLDIFSFLIFSISP